MTVCGLAGISPPREGTYTAPSAKGINTHTGQRTDTKMIQRDVVIALLVVALSYALSGCLQRLYSIYCVAIPSKVPPQHRVRVALIGAAKIASQGLLYPAQRVETVEVVAVAAREPERARKLAERWGIVKYGSYEAILADPEVDAVYIALINGVHFHWAAAALKAGKHVLCEKPLTSNAAEARELARLANEHSLILMEGYHNLHHPIAHRMRQLVTNGELGKLTHLEVTSGLPSAGAVLAALGLQRPAGAPPPDKMNPALGGGRFLSQGCYAVSMVRFLLGEPDAPPAAAVRSAVMVEDAPGSRADISTEVYLSWRGGEAGDIFHSRDSFSSSASSSPSAVSVTLRHTSVTPMGFNVHARFDNGSFYAFNFLFPFVYHYLRVCPSGAPSRIEKHYLEKHDAAAGAPSAASGAVSGAMEPPASAAAESSFSLQLRAFASAVVIQSRRNPANGSPKMVQEADALLAAFMPESAVRNLELIDAIYDAAKLGKRG